MTFDAVGAHPVAALPGAAAAAVVIATLGPLQGYGEQSTAARRYVRFWVHETPRVYWAKETDIEMLGTVDLDPYERVWREIDWKDVLSGAEIQSATYLPETGLTMVSYSTEGTVTRFLVRGSATADLFVGITASDGSKRGRRLRYRVREL